MKISQIILETSTTAGVVATVAKPLGEVQQRTPVNGLEPISKIMKGTAKKKGPYANSLSEGAVKQYAADLKELTDEEFKKKYNKTKQEARKAMKEKPNQVDEAKLEEDDIILVPGQGRLKKTGFVKHDPDKTEHEGQTLKNSLHTIIRVATHLDKALATQDNFPEWVSEKIGAVKSNMVAVMDYLISAKEMHHDSDAMESGNAGTIAGGIAAEGIAGSISGGVIGGTLTKSVGGAMTGAKLGSAAQDMFTKEGKKVDRMVKHVAQSEKKLGHGKKEAENIAWATANKRGMLNNKNKKAK